MLVFAFRVFVWRSIDFAIYMLLRTCFLVKYFSCKIKDCEYSQPGKSFLPFQVSPHIYPVNNRLASASLPKLTYFMFESQESRALQSEIVKLMGLELSF